MTYRFLAVLDTMWGDRAGKAPRHFVINPHNFSGRRLYTLTGYSPVQLYCTNCCRERVAHSSHHGIPDVAWLAENLERWLELITVSTPTLLVCGKVAQATYTSLPQRPGCRTLLLPHPAARHWTKSAMAQAAQFVQEGKTSLRLEVRRGRLEVHTLCQ